jgi:hypothetical protein
MHDLERLERLNRLRTEGALTEEEFEAQKRAILEPKPDRSSRHVAVAVAAVLLIAAMIVTFVLLRPVQAENESVFPSETTLTPAPLTVETPTDVLPVGEMPNAAPSADEARAASIRWATSRDVLGANPAFVEQRLGVPREKDRHGLTFNLNGCEVRYSLEGTVVKSFYVRTDRNCRLNLNGRTITAQTTLGSLARQGARWEASCLALCGNAADPTVNLVEGGSRADGFVTVSYATSDSQAVDAWAEAVERLHGYGPFDIPAGVESPFQDAKNPPAAALPSLLRARVNSVFVERGY